ncbi:MAG: hypothetical protein IPL75_09170 [Acidobacteria bacterium]|nr:hypothetical protein [Acidobacteriota bacterium]
MQVLSAQWMPFVLYGFRRFLETGRRRSLVGGSAALVAQNLSCGYYLLFFSPFAAAYVVYELAARRRLRDWATWRAFSIAAVVVGAMTLPFLLPYLSVRDSGVGVRSLGEISMFSADVHAFATAPGWSWLWGERLDTFLRPEGEAFPGLSVLGLAAVGILAGLAGRWPSIRQALVRGIRRSTGGNRRAPGVDGRPYLRHGHRPDDRGIPGADPRRLGWSLGKRAACCYARSCWRRRL